MTAQEVADLLKVGKKWVYQATREGYLPHVKMGRHYRYRRETIEEWAREQEAISVG